MLLVALWILLEWYLEAKSMYPATFARLTDWAIWLFFVFETGFLTYLVRDRRRYLNSNWINLLIIIGGFPVIWGMTPYAAALRSLRLLFLLSLLFHVSRTIREILSRNQLGMTLLVGLGIIVMAGTLIAGIDPGIDTAWDGIWWAWVTVSTVGYGDIVPESPAGKIFGAVLILLGLGLFSLLTANFSAFFISREEDKVLEKEEELIREEDILIRREHAAAAKLDAIEGRLAKLEAGLEQLLRRSAKHDPKA